MKKLMLILLFVVSGNAHSEPYKALINEIDSGDISLQTLSTLVTLDQPEYMTGYGLCMAAGRSGCNSSGTLGYGLCMAAGRSGCSSSSSLGYGLCMAAGRSGCSSSGSIGYGLCMAAGRSGCSSN